jgi:hypothetical protein
MIDFIERIIESWIASGVVAGASFQGGVTGAVLKAALAIRTARLSIAKLLAASDEKASDPDNRLRPARLLDKFTIFDALDPLSFCCFL